MRDLAERRGKESRPRGTYLRYCAGAPFVGRSTQSIADRHEIGRLAWLLLARAGIVLAVTAGATVTSLWSMKFYSPASIIPVAIMVFSTVAVLLGVPYLLFAKQSWLVRSVLLFRDLKQGTILTFEGEFDEHPDEEWFLRNSMPEGCVAADCTRLQLQVLPRSSLIWRINGVLQTSWQVAKFVDAAVAGETYYPCDQNSRQLSETERKEVRAYANRRMSSLATILALFAGLALFVAWSAFETSPWWVRLNDVWHFAFFLSLLCANIVVLRNDWSRIQELRRDAESGTVEIRLDSVPGKEQIKEVLPSSEVVWTVNHLPAKWRAARINEPFLKNDDETDW